MSNECTNAIIVRYARRQYATYVPAVTPMRQTSAYPVFNTLEDRNISKVVNVIVHTTVPNALVVFTAQQMIIIIIIIAIDVRFSGN